MIGKRIVYTRIADGGVSVCAPVSEAIAWMGCGGYWNGHSRGFLNTQIERMIEAGHGPDVSRRYAHAMQFGGCTTAEALEIIRDRDCAHLGTAIELWDASDVPADRYFRDAWKRSQNGGPISVNLKLAKPIQFLRAKQAVETENKKRNEDFYSPRPLIEIDWPRFRERVMRAREETELRWTWPEGL